MVDVGVGVGVVCLCSRILHAIACLALKCGVFEP